MSNDPLLQPYQLKHLTLRNRIMITSHEPAYPEDGMPKGRYPAYHVERAKAGVALTMTAGSASVARDSPPVFNNILAWKDEVVGHMKQLVDEVYFDLKMQSKNLGEVDYDALVEGRNQHVHRNPEGLFRIGDAVAARNTHAAIYDALRLVKDL